MSIEQTVYDMLAPTVESLGFELWGVAVQRSGKFTTLMLYIDAEKGISVDDCATVSHHASGILDVEDPINTQYDLQVSSPGMDRQFFFADQYADYIGETLDIRLVQAVNKGRKWKAKLLSVTDNGLMIEPLTAKVDAFEVAFDLIDRARLMPCFEKGQKR